MNPVTKDPIPGSAIGLWQIQADLGTLTDENCVHEQNIIRDNYQCETIADGFDGICSETCELCPGESVARPNFVLPLSLFFSVPWVIPFKDNRLTCADFASVAESVKYLSTCGELQIVFHSSCCSNDTKEFAPGCPTSSGVLNQVVCYYLLVVAMLIVYASSY